MGRIAIFDMDGTLIDSGRDITESINYVRRIRYNLEPMSVDAVVRAINTPARNLAEIFYNTPIYEGEAREIFEEHYYEQCIQNVVSYEGISETLSHLHAGGVRMGVATNAPGIFARRMLSYLGLAPYFGLILGADDVETPKPHPDMLYAHLNHHLYQEGTDYAWMIGDNLKDMEAARNAGIRGIFAAWGFSAEGEGDYFAASPYELIEIICNGG